MLQSQFKTEYKIQPINGIYRFNLCPENNCSDYINCRYLHPQWAKNICVSYLNDECEMDGDHEKLQHIEWIQLQGKIHLEKSLGLINPDNLCLKNESQCDCDKHLPNMNDICLEFFKGLCPYLRCIKQHIFWEDFTRRKQSVVEKGYHTPVYLREIELLHLRHEIKVIDIIFIMDFTGSMAKWLEYSSQQIYSLIQGFKSFIQDALKIRVGFVGYRDFCDGELNIVFHDLTCQIDKVKQFISIQKATGGGDAAEDVYGGIKKAYELSITRDKESILVTFLFADAPTHGIQYHDGVNDDYKDKIEKGQLEKLMQEYMSLKLKNFFICVSINKSTDKMFEIMRQNFQDTNGEDRLFITEPTKPEDFKDMVEFNLKVLLCSDSMAYLNQMQCIKCLCTYNRTKFLSPNQYLNGLYVCDKCIK